MDLRPLSEKADDQTRLGTGTQLIQSLAEDLQGLPSSAPNRRPDGDNWAAPIDRGNSNH